MKHCGFFVRELEKKKNSRFWKCARIDEPRVLCNKMPATTVARFLLTLSAQEPVLVKCFLPHGILVAYLVGRMCSEFTGRGLKPL